MRWATGNLVANGANGAKIGEPGDGGLYFQFGSLIGWKGGESGDGTGRAAKANNTYCVNSSFKAVDEVQVVPAPFKQIDAIGTTWPNQLGTNLYYFGHNLTPYETAGTDIHDFTGFSTGLLAISGVGDPCRYYLGDAWRLPTQAEFQAMTDAATKTHPGTWNNGTSTDSYFVCAFSGVGELKFPAVGLRNSSGGAIYNVGDRGYYWSSSVSSSDNGYNLYFFNGNVSPKNINVRRLGFPVRCVSGTYVAPHKPTPPTGDQIVEIDGLKWTKGNLVATDAANCKVGAVGDNGLYFQYGGLVGYKGGANGDGVGVINGTTHTDGKWWNGAAAYSADDVAVAPVTYTNQATWPTPSSSFGYYYFNDFVTKYADFQSRSNSLDPANGIGDPCAYYLGGEWRLPKYDELTAITGSKAENTWIPWATAGVTGAWTDSGPQSTKGAWLGPTAKPNPTAGTDLFIPVSGYRVNSSGAFSKISTEGVMWSSSAFDATQGYASIIASSGVRTLSTSSRDFAFPVRCVTGTLLIHKPTPPTADQIVEINGLKWTTGNLVATDASNAKVGAPGDGGLYFQFGSLIGWKGGATGDGTGRAAKVNGTFYSGASFNAADEVQVMPAPFKQIDAIGTTWPSQTTNLYYFGLSSYSTNGANLHNFTGFSSGTMAADGVGDPCRYYLGGDWWMPTNTEFQTMHDAATITRPGSWTQGTSTNSYLVFTFSGIGEIKFPAVGLRNFSGGMIFNVGSVGYSWSSSVNSSTQGYFLYFSNSNVTPQDTGLRRIGMPVRCVSDDVVEIAGTKWATGNLVADGANGAKIGKPEDGGLYFQYGSLIGWKGGASGDGTGRTAKADNTFYSGGSFSAANEVQVYPSLRCLPSRVVRTPSRDCEYH